MKPLSRVLTFVFFVAIVVGAFCLIAPAQSGVTLPVASFVAPVPLAPGANVEALDVAIDVDIEADVSAENLNTSAAVCRAKPGVRLELFLDRALTQRVLDAQLDGVTAGFFHGAFDGALDFAGTSGDSFTTSRVHRSTFVHVDVPPELRARLATQRIAWLRVRQTGSVNPSGHWSAAIDEVRAAVTVSVVPVTL